LNRRRLPPMRGGRFALLLLLTAAGSLFAQTNGPRSLGGFVLSETPALDAAPNLARWRTLHSNEGLKPATYDNEYETQGLWCAASVAEVALPGGVKATRLAFFYAPSAKPGLALPARQDAGLVQQCRLLALWYEVHDPADPGDLAKSVSGTRESTRGTGSRSGRKRSRSGCANATARHRARFAGPARIVIRLDGRSS
jgi:hypothetical protein